MYDKYDNDETGVSTPTRRMGRQSADVAEQTKESIVEAALHVFARQGYEATSLRDIADEAGVTHGLIRHYYESKAGVWQAVIDFVIQRFTNALLPTIQQGGELQVQQVNLRETVETNIRNFLLVCARYPEMMQIMVFEGVNGGARFGYVISRFERIDDAMSSLLAPMQQLGYLRQFDSRTFFLYLLTAGGAPFGLHALSTRLIGKDILSEEQVQRHIERFIATLF